MASESCVFPGAVESAQMLLLLLCRQTSYAIIKYETLQDEHTVQCTLLPQPKSRLVKEQLAEVGEVTGTPHRQRHLLARLKAQCQEIGQVWDHVAT